MPAAGRILKLGTHQVVSHQTRMEEKMHIPHNAVIPEEKITGYLLARREVNDKSGFLNNAGLCLLTTEN